MSVPKHPPLGG